MRFDQDMIRLEVIRKRIYKRTYEDELEENRNNVMGDEHTIMRHDKDMNHRKLRRKRKAIK